MMKQKYERFVQATSQELLNEISEGQREFDPPEIFKDLTEKSKVIHRRLESAHCEMTDIRKDHQEDEWNMDASKM